MAYPSVEELHRKRTLGALVTDEPNEDEAADALFGEAEKPARKTRQAKAVVEEVRLHKVLSNEDFLAAQALARKKIDKERRVAAMKRVEAEETERLRVEEGLTTGSSEMDELVDIQIDLPEFTNSITVNKFPYMHGRSYRVARHVYNSLMEQIFRARKHDDQTEGKSMREAYARKRDTLINGNTGVAIRAPERLDA